MFLTRSLNRKLLAAFLLLGLLPLLIFSTISANRSSQSMEEQIFSQLEAVRTIKNSQINQYFNEREADLRLLAKMTNIIFEDAKQKLKVIHTEQLQLLQGDATLPSSSDKAHATVFLISPEGQLLWGSEKTSTEITSLKDLPYVQEALSNKTGVGLRIGLKGKLALLHWSPIKRNGQVHAVVTELDLNQAFQLTPASGQANFFTDYIHQYGYYDLFLINNDGYVFHTISQEADYQTNLRNGPFQNSNLARIFKQATQSNDYALADFEPYAPSNDEPASFIAIPLPASGNASEIVVALQLSIDSINRVMQERAGMGDSGETYLVGPDYRMRSDSYLDPADRTVSASFAGSISQNGADTEASRSAIAGKSGVDIIQDYNGNPVLSAYAPVDINDGSLRWAIIAELDQSEAFAPVYKQVQLAITLTLIAAVVIIVAGTLLARSISQPIVTIAKHASYIAHGDLTHTIAITQHDEVGELQQSMHSMNQTLRDTVTHISQSAAQQSAASEQLAAITEETRRNVDIQHHSTDQVASAINQMAATVQEVSRNTQSAADAAYKSQSLVQDGGQVVTQTTEGIHHLAEELDNSSQLIKELEQKANNIGSILDVIKGIAEQTNLLALNAAIEAARAGEQGRGFAVVADEVRSLAQSTQQSASEIEVMIQELQNGSNRSVEAMNRGHKKTEEIVQQASQLTTALDDIQQSVSAISDMNTQIASAAEQQSSVANDINENAVAISNKSEETGQSAQQIAIASEELSRLANELHEQIAQFKLS